MTSETRKFFLSKVQKHNAQASSIYEEIVKNSDENLRAQFNVEAIYNMGMSLKTMRQALIELSQHVLVDFYEYENGFVTFLTRV